MTTVVVVCLALICSFGIPWLLSRPRSDTQNQQSQQISLFVSIRNYWKPWMWWVLGISVGILIGYLLIPPTQTWSIPDVSGSVPDEWLLQKIIFLKPFVWLLIPIGLTLIEFRKRRGLHWMVIGIFVLSTLTVYMVLNPAEVIAWQQWLFHHNVRTEEFMELWYVKYLIGWLIIDLLPLWLFVLWFVTSDDQQWKLFAVTWIIALLVLFLVNNGIIA